MEDTEQPVVEPVVEVASEPVAASADVFIVTCDRLVTDNGDVFMRGQAITDLSEDAAANYLAAERIARV